MKNNNNSGSSSHKLKLNANILASYWFAGLIAVFLIWSSNFTLDQYVRATGLVMPSSKLHSIQTQDAGVIDRIYVSEGQPVKTGDILLNLQTHRIEEELGELDIQLKYNEIQRVRLNASISGENPEFSPELAKFQEFITLQKNIFFQRLNALNEKIDGLKEKKALANSQYEIYESLFKTGDISLVELNQSKEQLISIDGEIKSALSDYESKNFDELDKVMRELIVLKEKHSQSLARIKDSIITSPLNGVVNNINVETAGSVLKAGQSMIDISPADGTIYMEIKVNPAEVGSLTEGLPVSIKFDTFDFTIYGSLKGILMHLSNDIITETGATGKEIQFYKAYVILEAEQENQLIDIDSIRHGMGVSVDILTGSRTVLQYISKPILRGFNSALGEK